MFKAMAEKLELPGMRMIQQVYEVPPPVSVGDEVDREWNANKDTLDLAPGASIAVGVGSRGISNLAETVRAVGQSRKFRFQY